MKPDIRFKGNECTVEPLSKGRIVFDLGNCPYVYRGCLRIENIQVEVMRDYYSLYYRG